VGNLKMLPLEELIKERFTFHPNRKFLNIGVEEFWIIEHRLPILVEHLCNINNVVKYIIKPIKM